MVKGLAKYFSLDVESHKFYRIVYFYLPYAVSLGIYDIENNPYAT